MLLHSGKTRLMERRCGTPPYAAPEVVVGAGYQAEPADIWSCGIVLVALLAGELPWDEPTERLVIYTKCRHVAADWHFIKDKLSKKCSILPKPLLSVKCFRQVTLWP